MSTVSPRAAVLLAGCLAALFVPSFARAQTPGELDTTFTSVVSGGTLFALYLESLDSNATTDVFVGGDVGAEYVLDPSGNTVDLTVFGFADFGNVDRIIYTAVPELVDNDVATNPHKLLVGGLFGRGATQIDNNQTAQNIARLLPDGALDPNFVPGAGANAFVTSILPLSAQYGGGIVVGGQFTQFNRLDHARIVRLDNGGTIVDDSVFDSKLTFGNTILSLATQQNPDAAGPQGQILAAGLFNTVNNQPYSHLARINADGSVDASFHPIFGDQVRVVISQADGKILVGGDFETVNGATIKHLVRLNYDGSVDTGFNAQVTTQPTGIAAPVAVNVITPDATGGYYIGGNFAQINGVTRNFLGHVLADGTVDSFDPGNAVLNAVQQIAIAPKNLIYVTETRSKSVNDKVPPPLIRLFGADPVEAAPVSSSPVVSTVSISAAKPDATEAGPQRGVFELVRNGGDMTQALTVYLKLKGTGASRLNTDYTIPTTQLQPSGDFYVATLPANQTGLKIRVRPVGAAFAEASETITLKIKPDQSSDAKYTVSTALPVAATVTLRNE